MYTPSGRREASAAPRTVYRLRLAVTCLLLTGLVFRQNAGLIIPDTKLDLTADPLGLLARALHFWDPEGSLGQVQDQAYGYLFPMGPFFVAGDVVGLPDWTVQRLWLSALLCVALLGVVGLADRLDIATPHTRLLAGLVYALSPRMLSELGPISAEILPMALLPWVVIALVTGARAGSPRRAAALSGLAVLCAGGVNAVATLAVLPPAALWLLTRTRGPRRRALMAWWSLAVGLATLWWVVPLLLLGRYSPPFLDYIEQADVTTSPTSLVEVLRGTSHWLAYLVTDSGPSWNAGWLLVSRSLLVLDTVLLVAVGLAGLALRDMPHRGWLVCTLLLGLALVTFGHVATLSSPVAHTQREWLDGVLAPFRNVHKFEPVVRLPLVLGLAHVAGRAAVLLGSRVGGWRSAVRGRNAALRAMALLLVCAAALVGAASPLISNRIAPRGSYQEIPPYWHDTAAWLADRADEGAAMLVPASGFGDYLWGKPNDEPMQPLAGSRWVVRGAVPLTPPGTIRMLDAVERVLYSGLGSPGLAPYLSRAGVRFLVLRNDLDSVSAGATRQLLARQALARSPGVSYAAGFGPTLITGGDRGLLVDQALQAPGRAVEIYRVDHRAEPVTAYRLDQTDLVYGGPESLLALEERGWLGGRPVVLAVNASNLRGLGRTIVTDGLRRREVNVGRVTENASPTLPRDAPVGRTPPDYLPGGAEPYLATARYEGIVDVTATSSRASPDALGGARLDQAPFAALDGDSDTAWVPDRGAVTSPQQLTVRLPAPRQIRQVELRFAWNRNGDGERAVTVSTDAGSVARRVRAGTDVARFALPGAATSTVRVEFGAVAPSDPLGETGIAELRTDPPVEARRAVIAPAPQSASGPSWYALDTAAGFRPGCLRVNEWPRCADGLARGGEEDAQLSRGIGVAAAGQYEVGLVVRPTAGPELEALIDAGGPVTVRSSSRAVADPNARPAAALDGNRRTGWIAAPGDERPVLDLTWQGRRRVGGLRVVTDGQLAASPPSAVVVTTARGDRISARLSESGEATFGPVLTDNLRVEFTGESPRSGYDPYARTVNRLPIGVSEVTVRGAPDLVDTVTGAREVRLPCGFGPRLRVNGRAMPTEVVARVSDLLDSRTVRARVCAGPLELPAGTSEVLVDRAGGFAPVSVSLTPAGAVTAPTRVIATQPVRWDATSRAIRIAERTSDTLLVMRENTNPGWQARLGGQRLRPVVADGWQQAFVVPAGAAGEVRITFAPDRWYRAGLLAGLLAVVVLLGLCVLPSRVAGPPPSGGRVPPMVGALAAACLILVGGWAALAAALAVGVLLAMPGRQRGPLALGLAPGAFLVAGGWLALHPWGDSAYGGAAAWVQALCLVAVAAVVVAPHAARLREIRAGLARHPAAQSHDRLLDDEVARGGGENGQRPGEREDDHEAAGEGRAVQ